MRQIGDRPFEDTLSLAPTLAQEDGGRRIAVGNSLDVRGNYFSRLLAEIKLAENYLHGNYFHRKKSPKVF